MIACPVIIRGVRYESQAEAAKALGVHPGTVKGALDRGTLDYCGLGRNYRTKRPVYVDGVRYESMAAGARAIGVREEVLASQVLKKGYTGVYEFEYRGHMIKRGERDD